MQAELIVLLLLCIISSLLFIIYRVHQGGKRALFFKTIASLFFVVTAIYLMTRFNSSTLVGFMVIGMICGLIGDIMLDLKVIYEDDELFYLNSGYLFFGIGHVLYFLSIFKLYSISQIAFLLPLLLAFAIALFLCVLSFLGYKKMKFNLAGAHIQTFLYSFSLAFVTIFSLIYSILSKSHYIFSIGLILFLLSDVILSIMYFNNLKKNSVMCIINHVLYYGAQILIALSIYFI